MTHIFTKETLFKLGLIAIVLLYFALNYPHFYPLPELTTIFTSRLLNWFSFNTVTDGNLIVPENFPALEVSAECSGIILLLIFPLTIFLIPSVSLNHKLASLLFVPLLFVGNILRITFDAFIGFKSSPEILIFFHNTFGQLFLFFWAITLYVIWLKVFGNFPKEAKAVSPDGLD